MLLFIVGKGIVFSAIRIIAPAVTISIVPLGRVVREVVTIIALSIVTMAIAVFIAGLG